MAVNVNIPKPSYTKEEIGLGNVDNTSDVDKPISTATQTALNNKVDKVTGKSLIDDSEISRLASMTAIFTSALKTAYDSSVTWISTNGSNLLNHLTNTSNPHSTTATQVDALKRDGSNANSDVDLGTYSLNTKSVKVNGTAGTGCVGLKHQSSGATATGSESVIYADASGNPKWKNDGNAVQSVMLENSAITGATKTKITYDPKGLVTSGADATTADIADSTNKRYVTDAQLTVIGNTSNTNTGDETSTTIKSKLGIFQSKLTSGNQTTTSASQVAVTELKVTPTINKRYNVKGLVHVGCGGGGGVRIGITIPTGATIFITGFGTGAPASTNSVMSFITASGGTFQNTYSPSSANGMCIIDGEIEMSSTSGDVQITVASVTSGQTTTVYSLGSFLQLTEI